MTQNKLLIILLCAGFVKDKKTGEWRSTREAEDDNFTASPGGRLRVVAASCLHRQYPHSYIFVPGGVGGDPNVQNVEHPYLSAIIKNELLALGVNNNKIITETKSNTTWEQLERAAILIQKEKFNQTIIISSAWHLPRIQAFLDYIPSLKKLCRITHIKFQSAEEICLQYNAGRWQGIINRANNSQQIKKRIQLERQGIKDLKAGNYKFK